MNPILATHARAKLQEGRTKRVEERSLREFRRAAAPTQPHRPFDLYLSDDGRKVRVRGFEYAGTGGQTLIYVAGNHITGVEDGADALNLGDEITITGNTCLYLQVDRANNAITFEKADSWPDGTDSQEIVPLWFLPWDSENEIIDWDNRCDLRGLFHWTAGA
jgi:hypothetical protein